MVFRMSESLFYEMGCQYINHDVTQSTNVGNRRFQEHFGVPPIICSIIWDIIKQSSEVRPCHLLWALQFLKTYNTEHVMCSILKVDEKTLRKWVWKTIDLIADLSVVRNK